MSGGVGTVAAVMLTLMVRRMMRTWCDTVPTWVPGYGRGRWQ